MTTFLLLRRASLCFLVGLTDFGLSGYLLRPRPTWECKLPNDQEDFEFLIAERDLESAEPIWLKQSRSFLSIDPSNGAPIKQWRWSNADDRGDGQICIDARGRVQTIKPDGESSLVQVLDGLTGDTVIERKFDGGWTLGDAGGLLWRCRTYEHKLVLQVADIELGNIATHDLLTPGSPLPGNPSAGALSPEGSCLVVREPIPESKSAPPSFLVWDVASNRMLYRVTIPLRKNGDTQYISSLKWVEGGKRVAVETYSSRESIQEMWPTRKGWVFDPETKELFADDDAPSLHPAHSGTDWPNKSCNSDTWIWPTPDEQDESTWWFSLVDDRRRATSWRRFPFAVVPAMTAREMELRRAVVPSYFGRQKDSVSGFLVPKTSSLVMRSYEAPAWRIIPESIMAAAPPEWTDPEIRVRWHEWKRNVWRDVGFRGRSADLHADLQVRPTSVIVLSRSAVGDPVLESWPLPPRDPKWPAAAIGLAALALVWCLCGRRAKRPRRMAA